MTLDMVMEDVTELYVYLVPNQWDSRIVRFLMRQFPLFICFISNRPSSDYTGAQIKLPKLLLNGNNVCMVRTSSVLLTARRLILCSLVDSRWGRARGQLVRWSHAMSITKRTLYFIVPNQMT